MKSVVRLKYMFFLIFAFLFVNLLSINVSRVKAEDSLDLSNAYRGEINNYWALVNYGDDYIGQDSVTIFLDPEVFENENVNYIQINEINRYGDVDTTYFKKGVDSSFASRFTYNFVNSGYGGRYIVLYLLEDLGAKPTDIIERIDIDGLERVRTIEHLSKDDFNVYQEVTAQTSSPYKVYVEIKNNKEQYKLKDVRFTYTHYKEGVEEEVTGSAIEDPANHRFYFTVSENAIYNIEVEDYFGFVKETYPIEINNLYGLGIYVVANYSTDLAREVPVYISVYDADKKLYHGSHIETILVSYSKGNPPFEIKHTGVFTARENGVYTIYCKTTADAGGLEATIEINITNIDTIAPSAFVTSLIRINSSDVETAPYVFDPTSYILATDNASLGDNLEIKIKYYKINPAYNTCESQTQLGELLSSDPYAYLYGVNDLCIEYEVSDEVGNSSFAFSKITVTDNTIPIVSAGILEIILQIGDDKPENDALGELFALTIFDNSGKPCTVTGDFSEVDLENLGVYPVKITATDQSGNVSKPLSLTVIVTERILLIDAVAKQYIVYGEPMIEILYTCNGNPCVDDEDAEILPADWGKLSGELYITSGSKYAGTYPVYSSLAINSDKYRIVIGTLGNFVIKQRTFKIVANSYEIDYKDAEPTFTWYMDTSVCGPGLTTTKNGLDEMDYSCTFLAGDRFGGGSYVYDDTTEPVLHAGGIRREPGITVKYDAARNVIYYKIHLGDLNVIEASSGGKINYYLDFYGLYDGLEWQETYRDEHGVEHQAGARFYIYPKYVEVTFEDVTKIYGESDPYTTYRDDTVDQQFVGKKREDGKTNIQYEFTCFSYKEPVRSMTTSECQVETGIVVRREEGENVGEYKIIGEFTNENYDVRFNEQFDSGYVAPAYLEIIPRKIQISIDGEDGNGKYTIFYEDALPTITVSVTSDPNITYEGLAHNAYSNINNGDIISISDKVSYGAHPVIYKDSDGNIMNIIIGGYNEYIEGVGLYSIERDSITIVDYATGVDVLANYDLDFKKGQLEVLARQIYIQIVEGFNKIYGDFDPSFDQAYVTNKYGASSNYIVDGNGKFVLKIINTLDNTIIQDRDDYEPFDKDKLKYYLKRNNIRIGQSSVDVHDGEMVGEYLINCERFENDSNYIIDIYQEYHFEIKTREISLTLHDGIIEFNYDNILPVFSYEYTNAVFGDTLIGQPKVGGYSGLYRNNGDYILSMGEIIALSSAPLISSVSNTWYINGESTGVSLEDFANLDLTLIKVVDGKYHIIDVNTNSTIDTGISLKEVNVMWNYTFKVEPAALQVIPRNVIVVPKDDSSKQYGESNYGIEFGYEVRHWPDGKLEAILDPTDFTGKLSREEGEKPGLYEIIQGTLTPASKGADANFNIMGFDSNHFFEITRRELTIRLTYKDITQEEIDGSLVFVISYMYGNENFADIVNEGYTYISGSLAFSYDEDMYTYEYVDGVDTKVQINDVLIGRIKTDPSNPENVGEYLIKSNDLRIVRATNNDIDVTDEYYNFTFAESILRIRAREIHITPNPGQSKIYGENDNTGTVEGCGIGFTYSPHLIKATDVFSGCLKRGEKVYPDGTRSTEDAGEYPITLGDLKIMGSNSLPNNNYELILDEDKVMFIIKQRPITITAKVEGDEVTRIASTNQYTMIYGNSYTLSYDIGGMGLAHNIDLGIDDYFINNVKLCKIDATGACLESGFEEGSVGQYEVIEGILTTNCPRNYNRTTYTKAYFTITKRVIDIQPYNVEKIYGEDDPVFLYEILNADPDLPRTGSLSRISGNQARLSYQITQGSLSFGDNYDVNVLEAYLYIKPREIIVTAHERREKFGISEEPIFTFDAEVVGEFNLTVEPSGMLTREDVGNYEAGTYAILLGTLNFEGNINYEIIFNSATFEIYYVEITQVIVKLLSGHRYQTRYEEEPVELYAQFNEGANPVYLKDVTWTITKTGGIDIEFTKDINNIIKFTPSGSAGTYVIRATYNGISGTFDVVVATNNVSQIFIQLDSGYATQTLGKETPITYLATVHLLEEREEDLYIEWYAGNEVVCNYLVGSINKCTFTPNLKVGTHNVYAKINSVVSESLQLVIKDNEIPVITLEKNGTFYIEARQNATENSIQFDPGRYSAIDDVDGDISHRVIIRGLDSINYYKVGTYYVIYEVTDQHGHVANNYQTVIIEDTVPPVVKLNVPELTDYTIEYGDLYIEFGATAYDAYDSYYNSGAPLQVYIDSNLNIDRVGDYEVIYFAVDSNGLRGQAIRTVHVKDMTKPTITLIGDDILYFEYKEMYIDQGAWFDDNYDGRYKIYATKVIFQAKGSMDMVEVSSVDTSILGTYYLTYSQSDSSGNPPEEDATRIVIVQDTTPPVITLLGSNPYILRYGTTYVDPGYKVIDNYDGDITNNPDLVSVVEVIGDTLGTYYVYYRAKDTNGNYVEITREVVILDLVSPILYFTETCPQYMTVEALDPDRAYDLRCNTPGYGYTVVDDYLPDIGAIQDWVVYSGSVDNNTVGVYEIKYDVSDRSGNAAVTLTRYVTVVDTTPPVVTLLPNASGDIDFYVEVFSEYIEPGWELYDEYDEYHGLITTIEVVNNINVNKLNTYTVMYIATDSNGNKSEPVYRDITVRDTVPPVVTLIGEPEIVIERGTRYAEYGATAKDNYDGILSDIVITGAPTGMIRDVFEVKYCATDSSGNTGCTTRKVTVVDTIAPIVLGVEDGKYYRTPLYIYFSPLTGTDEILTGRLNDALITSPWYVSKEGKYHLTVTDDAGNATVIDFAIDLTPPVLLGVNDGEYVNYPVNLHAEDDIETFVYRFNNGGYVTINAETLLFEAEGQYWVYAIDKAGNVGNPISFVIDTTPPIFVLSGVLNGGITNTDVTLQTENNVTVSVNNKYIPTNYTFSENGYYQVTIRDIAGNDVFLQFVINKSPTVTINNQSVTFISQNNAIGKFEVKPDSTYPKGVGFIYAKPLLEGGFKYVSGKLFSDEEYNKLINGESIIFDVPPVNEDEMIVAFVVTLDELNKFTTQTVEGDDDSAIIYTIAAVVVGALFGGAFYFFVLKRRKSEEEEEEDVTIEDEDLYY